VPTGGEAEASPKPTRVFAVTQVRRQFRRQGLPLTEFTSASSPRVFESVRAGPVFQVDVYPTVEAAAENDGTVFYMKPASYRVRGDVTTGRKGNVVVIFEEGRASLRERVRTALESLE